MTPRIRIHPFSLRDTLECGQFFRFTKVLQAYLLQTSGRIFSLRQEGEYLFYEGVEESFLIDFFRLDEDLVTLLDEIDRDPIIHKAIGHYRGLRLIRQDPWECFISFLCSSAKAIPHIRSMIEILCKSSGKKTAFGNIIGYHFPEPSQICSPGRLAEVRAGFRTDYLLEAGRCIDREGLLALKGRPYQEARRLLMDLPGVGKKIADCTLLYSLDFLEAFPMDTWIKRGLQASYFEGKKTGEKRMEEFVSSHFGPHAGFAQLYLYHFWRNHPF